MQIEENRMWHPRTMEVRMSPVPTELAASVKAKNDARSTGFTSEERAEAELKLKRLKAEL